MKKNSSDLTEKIRKTVAFKFIVKYPRVAAMVGFIMFVLLIALPLPLEEKLTIPFRAMGFGLFIAFTIYCLKLFKSTPRS